MFFERFREALARLPAGLIRSGPPASAGEIGATEARLGRRLPDTYRSFLSSFDGADLFHEAVVLAGVGDGAPRRLHELNDPGGSGGPLVFAEATGGDRFAFGAKDRVLRLRAESDEVWLAGGDFGRWLDGTLAHQQILYGPDGEFAPDAFELDGEELVPRLALRQTERALRLCPDSAEWEHERGVALRRLGRLGQARDAFAAAARLDPGNPWPRFDLGRVALELGPSAAREAGQAFEAAARGDGAADSAGRLWTWAARAALLESAPERLALCQREALAREPALATELRRARDAARAGGDPQELAEAEALLQALEAPIPTGRVRLPIVSSGDQAIRPRKSKEKSVSNPDVTGSAAMPSASRPARPTPPPPPRARRRPGPGIPPRAGGSRVGRPR